MSFLTIDANKLIKKSKAAKKGLRELDIAAEEMRFGWKQALKVAEELTGKTSGLSLAECKRVIEEMKRRRFT